MKKQVIKLTEGDLYNIVKESAKKIIKEKLSPNEDLYTFNYRELCDLYEELFKSFENIGLNTSSIQKGLMPLHYKIKEIEVY